MSAVQVSIIIPTYNRATYIGEALTSIINQTYTHWECLVIDDGSTDNTKNIIDSFHTKDHRIRYIKRPNNYPKGSNGSRNYGLSLAQGQYIAFCDDDDYWLHDKLEKQIPIFQQHPEVGLVTGNIEYVNSDGMRTGRVIKQTGNHGYVFEEILLKNRLSMITPVIKREVFDKVGLFNTNFVIFEDWEYWRRVAYYYPFYALQDVLACVRKHDSNTSLIVTQKPSEQFVRYRKLTKALLKWGENRFTKADIMLIDKVEIKRYLQIMQNHCPNMKDKVGFIGHISINNITLGLKLFSSFIKSKL
ncbi:glycosyltransferase family 2 protein [Corallibacter sp.]|uniref:glycosyltransferase family 2 protein n=1 Tax=Corallibacter sp. TaxID=2038084 RepID=UPI003AB887F0